MGKVLAMDATGLNALEELHDRLRARDQQIVLSGPHSRPLLTMDEAGFLERLGAKNVCADFDGALQRAREILALKAGRPTPAASHTASL